MDKQIDVRKAGGIIIKNRKLLVVRHKNRELFISPGGKQGLGESMEETLIREIREEVSLEITQADLEKFGSFTATDAEHPERALHMEVFMIKKWKGQVKLNPEDKIGEFRWVDSVSAKKLKLGSIFEHDVLPKLKNLDLID